MQLRSASVRPRLAAVRLDPEAVGDCQPRPLADQHRDRLGTHRLADVIAQRDAALFGNDDRRDRTGKERMPNRSSGTA